jgi:hypothetical protein
METLAAAIALLLIIEGALYALFPGGMKRMLAEIMRMPEPMIRNAGLIATVLGLAILYLLYR